jgi:hypothetical protein
MPTKEKTSSPSGTLASALREIDLTDGNPTTPPEPETMPLRHHARASKMETLEPEKSGTTSPTSATLRPHAQVTKSTEEGESTTLLVGAPPTVILRPHAQMTTANENPLELEPRSQPAQASSSTKKKDHASQHLRMVNAQEIDQLSQRALLMGNGRADCQLNHNELVEAVTREVTAQFNQSVGGLTKLPAIMHQLMDRVEAFTAELGSYRGELEKTKMNFETSKQMLTTMNRRLDLLTELTTKVKKTNAASTGVGEALASMEVGILTEPPTPISSQVPSTLAASRSTPTSPQSPSTPWIVGRSPSNAVETIQVLARVPKQSEVNRVLSNEWLKNTPPSSLLEKVQVLTNSMPEGQKLLYAELAMSEDLKKEYEALPPTTKSNIRSIQSLCELFLGNKVTMSKAPTAMTLRPTASKGGYASELEANLQFLTNLQLANGDLSMSSLELLENCLPKQHQYRGVNQMAASQNPDGFSSLTNDQILLAFSKANQAFFRVLASTVSESTNLIGNVDDEAVESGQATFAARSTEVKCGGACTPAGQ